MARQSSPHCESIHNMAESEGVWSNEFADVVADAAKRLRRAGGGALCVIVDGEALVDMWCGFQDPVARTPWVRDTMAMSWSTTKGIASSAVHVLVDRGELSYDDLVVSWWPEFGVNGKNRTTVRQILSMEAGLFDVRHMIDDPHQLLDHDEMAARLAAATPWHEPGTANGYHAFTYGWLIAELVRRVTGTSLGEFVQQTFTGPLQLDGCFIGTPTSEHHRIAAPATLTPERVPVRVIAKAIDPLTSRLGFSPARYAAAFLPRHGEDVIGTGEFLTAEVPSVNGVFTARALARLYDALGSDHASTRLWSPATRAAATTRQNTRRDLVLPLKVGWRLGFHQPFPRKHTSPDAFGFYGAFGSGAYADPSRNLAVGLVCQQARGLLLSKLVAKITTTIDTTTASHTN